MTARAYRDSGAARVSSDPPTAAQQGHDSVLPVVVAVAAVLFNAVLAIVNGNVMGLNQAIVIVCEIALVGVSFLYALSRFEYRMQPWLVVMLTAFAFALVRMGATGAIEVKYFRDILLIITFVLLGMATSPRRMIQAIVIVQVAVVAGILLEATCPPCYSSLFAVKDFYIRTRGVLPEEFTNLESDLYVSATRPEARFFPFFDLHRLSSIFLEPVSLGNFAIIMVAFTAAMWRQLGRAVRVFMVAAIVLTLFASDGRLSAAASVMVLAACIVGRLLPGHAAFWAMPGAVLAAVGLTAALGLRSGNDDLPGRVAYSAELIAELGFADIMGLSDRLIAQSADTGLVYMIVTQSLLGFLLLWTWLVIAADESTLEQKRYKNGLFIYLAMTMMVSYSFLSIKTAAPLWFIYGALLGRPEDAPEGEPDHEPT